MSRDRSSFALVLLAAFAPGCDHGDAATEGRARERPQASAARAVLLEAGAEVGQGVDPPALAGDLAGEIEAFTTLDACVERRSRLDPLVGDALEAIGYDTLLRDACRLLDAAKARDARRCEPITASPLRERCVAAVAEIAGTADACPWRLDSHKDLGREPVCLALASRDSRLCAAASDRLGRVTCTAVARHSSDACDALVHPGDKARCARDVTRWGSLLSAAPTTQPFPSSGKLTATSSDPGAPGGAHRPAGPVEADLGAELGEGVVVVQQSGSVRITVGRLSDAGFSSATTPALALDLVVPRPGGESRRGSGAGPEAGAAARLERAEIALAGCPTLRVPPSSSTLVARVEKFDATRGGVLALALDGDVTGPDATWHVHANLTTFVRDVVPVESLFDRAPHPAGLEAPPIK
jgi:hypothetical protein